MKLCKYNRPHGTLHAPVHKHIIVSCRLTGKLKHLGKRDRVGSENEWETNGLHSQKLIGKIKTIIINVFVQNCQDNTEGDHCERCAPGFYGVVRGFHDDCKPCACPLTNNK